MQFENIAVIVGIVVIVILGLLPKDESKDHKYDIDDGHDIGFSSDDGLDD